MLPSLHVIETVVSSGSRCGVLDSRDSGPPVISWFEERPGGVGGVVGDEDGVVFILGLITKFIGPSERLLLMVRLKLLFLLHDVTVSFSSIISWFEQRPGGVGIGGSDDGVVFILELVTKFIGPSERLLLMVRLKLLFLLHDVTGCFSSIISWFEQRPGGVGIGGSDDGVVFILELVTKFIGPSERLLLMVRLKLLFLLFDVTGSFSSIISWFEQRLGGFGGVGGGEDGVAFILELIKKFIGPSERLLLMVQLKLLFLLLDVTVSPSSPPTLLILSLVLLVFVVRQSISSSVCIMTFIGGVVCDP
jgi:hypothetical protein